MHHCGGGGLGSTEANGSFGSQVVDGVSKEKEEAGAPQESSTGCGSGGAPKAKGTDESDELWSSELRRTSICYGRNTTKGDANEYAAKGGPGSNTN